jgi:hypothetical protein
VADLADVQAIKQKIAELTASGGFDPTPENILFLARSHLMSKAQATGDTATFERLRAKVQAERKAMSAEAVEQEASRLQAAELAEQHPYATSLLHGAMSGLESLSLGKLKGEDLLSASRVLSRGEWLPRPAEHARLRQTIADAARQEKSFIGKTAEIGMSLPGIVPGLGATKLAAIPLQAARGGGLAQVLKHALAGGLGFGTTGGITASNLGAESPVEEGIRQGAIGAVLPAGQTTATLAARKIGLPLGLAQRLGGAAGFSALESLSADPGERMQAALAGGMIGALLPATRQPKIPPMIDKTTGQPIEMKPTFAPVEKTISDQMVERAQQEGLLLTKPAPLAEKPAELPLERPTPQAEPPLRRPPDVLPEPPQAELPAEPTVSVAEVLKQAPEKRRIRAVLAEKVEPNALPAELTVSVAVVLKQAPEKRRIRAVLVEKVEPVDLTGQALPESGKPSKPISKGDPLGEEGAIKLGEIGRQVKTAVLDPAQQKREDALNRERALSIMSRVTNIFGPKLGQAIRRGLNLPPVDPVIAAARRFGSRLSEDILVRINRLRNFGSHLSPAEQKQIHEKAYTYATLAPDDPHRAVVMEHRKAMEDFADAFVELHHELAATHQQMLDAGLRAGQAGMMQTDPAAFQAFQTEISKVRATPSLAPATAARFRKPGVLGYVTNVKVPPVTARTTVSLRGFANRLVQSFMRRQIKGGESLADTAKQASELMTSRFHQRTDVPFQDLETKGYLTGVKPMLISLMQEGAIYRQIAEMKFVRDAPSSKGWLWRDATPGDPWPVAQGPGWGVLTGKAIHPEAYGELSTIVAPQRNGFMDLLSAQNEHIKESLTTSDIPRFPVKSLWENGLNAWNAGLSPLKIPLRIVPSIKSLINYYRGRPADPVMQALIDRGLDRYSMRAMEVIGGGEPVEFKEMELSSRWFPELKAKFFEQLAENLRFTKQQYEGRAFHEFFGNLAAFYRASRVTMMNLIPVPTGGGKAAGLLQASREVSSAIDLLFKHMTGSELMATGGAGPVRRTAQVLTGTPRRGMTPSEMADKIGDYWDPTKLSPFAQAISNVPLLPTQFIRWPIKLSINLTPSRLGGKGDWKNDPLGAATLLLMPFAITAVYKAITGKTDEQIQEQKDRDTGGDEAMNDRIAPLIDVEDGSTLHVQVGTLGLAESFKSYWPPNQVLPIAGESGLERFMRGYIAGTPVLGQAFEMISGKSTFTGRPMPKKAAISAQEVLGMVVPGGRTFLPWLRKAAKEEEARSRDQPGTIRSSDLMLRHLIGLPVTRAFPPETPEGKAQQMFRDYVDWQKKQVEAGEEGIRFRPGPILPKPPPDDASPEELVEYERLLELYYGISPGGMRILK